MSGPLTLCLLIRPPELSQETAGFLFHEAEAGLPRKV